MRISDWSSDVCSSDLTTAMTDDDPLFGLLVQLVLLSMVAIGGVNTVLPELYCVSVIEGGWMRGEEFTAFYVVGKSAHGPNGIFGRRLCWQIVRLGVARDATQEVGGCSLIIDYVG